MSKKTQNMNKSKPKGRIRVKWGPSGPTSPQTVKKKLKEQ